MAQQLGENNRETENGTNQQYLNLIHLIISPDPELSDQAENLISELKKQVSDPNSPKSGSLNEFLTACLGDIDRLLSLQLNEILHHEAFQRLESSWRGLYFLVKTTLSGPLLKIRVVNVKKVELYDDFEKSEELTESGLYEKIHRDEYDHFAGTPYGCLIGDYEFGLHDRDIELLSSISRVAASAHAPFLSVVLPVLLHLDSFSELSEVRRIIPGQNRVCVKKWNDLRKMEESRYVGLTLPRLLGRKTYAPGDQGAETFSFEEDVSGPDNSGYLWINPAFALGTCLTKAFAENGWVGAFSGIETGGLVEDLPVGIFLNDNGEIAPNCPTEIAITDRLKTDFFVCGFIPLTPLSNKNQVAFELVPSIFKPVIPGPNIFNAEGDLPDPLPYTFAASRFVHYLRWIMRDTLRTFQSRTEAENYLNSWLSQYLAPLDEPPAQSAPEPRFPLFEGRVTLLDLPDNPEVCRATVFINPHFQVDPLPAAMKVVVDLPKRYHHIDQNPPNFEVDLVSDGLAEVVNLPERHDETDQNPPQTFLKWLWAKIFDPKR